MNFTNAKSVDMSISPLFFDELKTLFGSVSQQILYAGFRIGILKLESSP